MSLRSTMEAAGNHRAHYDAACKEILGCKQILANIMGEVLEEFRGCSPEEDVYKRQCRWCPPVCMSGIL